MHSLLPAARAASCVEMDMGFNWHCEIIFASLDIHGGSALVPGAPRLDS